jgi:hypothetical protein
MAPSSAGPNQDVSSERAGEGVVPSRRRERHPSARTPDRHVQGGCERLVTADFGREKPAIEQSAVDCTPVSPVAIQN